MAPAEASAANEKQQAEMLSSALVQGLVAAATTLRLAWPLGGGGGEGRPEPAPEPGLQALEATGQG